MKESKEQKAKSGSCWASFYNRLPTEKQVAGAGFIALGFAQFAFNCANGFIHNDIPALFITMGIFALVNEAENNNVKPKQP